MINISDNKSTLLKLLEKEHYDTYYDIIYDELDRMISRAKLPQKKDYFILLRDNLKDILIGSPKKLESIKQTIEDHKSRHNIVFNKVNFLMNSNERLKELFNYEGFSNQYNSNNWGAYKLTKTLNINTCLYCNRQYTFTLEVIDKKRFGLKIRQKDITGRTRTQLDHFYSHSDYPYLGISLYNMIPCCGICNSSFKGSEEFSINSHLNPYHKSFHKTLRFHVKFKNNLSVQTSIDSGQITPQVKNYVAFFAGDTNEFDLVTLPQPGIKETHRDYIRAKGNVDSFHLENLYNMHKDYVSEIILKSIEYNRNHIEDIFEAHSHAFPGNRMKAVRHYLGNYVEEDDIIKRPLSKLTIDIAKEFKLI